MNQSLDELKKEEAKFFDVIADIRTEHADRISIEADLRRATKFIPKNGDKSLYLIDPKMSDILDGGNRDKYISWVSKKPGAKVLDLGCGSGWLALELARNGCHVEAYDISPKAIANAKRMLAENPYKEGFGSVNYHLQDVSEIDLGVEQWDAVSGWSAFHHMPDVPDFMERTYRALKSGGIVATMDDMPPGRLELGIGYFFEFILPNFVLTYRQKIVVVYKLLTGVMQLRAEVMSPMETLKHSGVEDIERILYEKFEVLVNVRFNAFVGTPIMRMTGPDSFRYFTARVLVRLDRLLCKIGLVKGFERIMVARKK